MTKFAFAPSIVCDLWLLRGSRVYCGSALDASTYATLMDAQPANAVFTDPPYNVRINGSVSGLGSVQHREFAMASGEVTEAEFTGFLTKAFSLLPATASKVRCISCVSTGGTLARCWRPARQPTPRS